ncbi:MAG: glycosyltransferase [Sulfuritalea sp.]|nr:glycosyltransferase [Sulfuritalea sp.]
MGSTSSIPAFPDESVCVHVTASINPLGGGPPRTVVRLADSLSSVPGVRVVLVSQVYRDEAVVASRSERVQRRLARSTSAVSVKCGLPVRSELADLGRSERISLIHNHGIWLPVNHWAANAALRMQVPLVIHPRGMLEPWSMSYHRLRKQIVMRAYQRRDLARASAFVATSQGEYESIRRIGIAAPVALIPNGVDFDDPDQADDGLVRAEANVRTVLFLSRIHPKKGLLELVRAWQQIRPDGWRLSIAGPDENGHLAEVLSLARELKVDGTIDYLGVVDGADKQKLFRSADIFVLPSFSENFGVVVVEALAQGLPVITTTGTPWRDLPQLGCGWCVDPAVAPLAEALRQAMSVSDDERRAMGQRGREYARGYDWDGIGQTTAAFYRWLLGRGPRPECVRLD